MTQQHLPDLKQTGQQKEPSEESNMEQHQFGCNLVSQTVDGAMQWNAIVTCEQFNLLWPLDEHSMNNDSMLHSAVLFYIVEQTQLTTHLPQRHESSSSVWHQDVVMFLHGARRAYGRWMVRSLADWCDFEMHIAFPVRVKWCKYQEVQVSTAQRTFVLLTNCSNKRDTLYLDNSRKKKMLREATPTHKINLYFPVQHEAIPTQTTPCQRDFNLSTVQRQMKWTVYFK